jgi:beta propeller repeat protein
VRVEGGGGRTAAMMLGAILLVCGLVWVCPSAARAGARCEDPGGATYAVSVNGNEKASPATNGELVAWAERVQGTWGIWVKRLRSGDQRGWYKAESLASCTSRPSHLSWAGDTVVWMEGAAPNGVVRACDLWGAPWVVAQSSAGEPAATEGYAVWVDYSVDPAGDIVATSLQGGDYGVVAVCRAPGAQRSPAVSDGLAVWQDAGDGDWDLWGCSLRGGSWARRAPVASATRCHPLTPGEPMIVSNAAGDQTNPAIWEDVIAWQDTRGGDSDIWAAWLADTIEERSAVARTCGPVPLEFESGPVCAAAGEQTAPTLSSPVVFWVDNRDATADIRAFDLASQESGIVCAEPGAQTDPSAGGRAVVWLDGRSGGAVMDVYGADAWAAGDDTPPFAPEWTDEDVITLFLAVFYDLGVFDDVRFSTDGGETWGDWLPLSDVVELPLTDGQGVYEIAMILRGNAGEFGPVTFVVHLDKGAPTAKALGAVKVDRGGKAIVRLRVRDRLSPRADVIVRIKDRRGNLVQDLVVKDLVTGKKVAARFACALPRGAYRCTLRARDLAGNVQRRADTVRLVVR